MKYFTEQHKKTYYLPALLFIVLISVFSFASLFLSGNEINRRAALAQVVASQVSNSLEVFSADRKRALEDLTLSWPAYHPSPIDWFHTQASNIKNMLPGISDIWWVNPDFTIRWNISLTDKDKLLGVHIQSFGLTATTLIKNGSESVMYQGDKLTSLYALQIDPNNEKLGYVVANFDVESTLEVLVGELIGPQFNFSLYDHDVLLMAHGVLVEDSTIAKVQLGFANRKWDLALQSPNQKIQMSQVIFWVGCLMSTLICMFFFWQLRSAVRLNQSQIHYKAASDAALDSILIYGSVTNKKGQVIDFQLVDANKLAVKLVKCDLNKPANLFLSQQLTLMQISELLTDIKQVCETGIPFEYTLNNQSNIFDAQWLRLQVVKADSGIAMTIRDISLRYQSQQQLKKSEARFRRLVDGLTRDYVYSLDSTGKLQFVSTSVTNILGYEAEDFLANSDNYLLCVPDNILQIREQQAKGLKTEPYIVTFLSTSKQEVSIECNDSPVFDEEGKLVAIEGIGRDVTEDLILKQKIYYQANHDPLTGLLNRYAFDQKLKEVISDIPSVFKCAALCYIDMDQFKLINDTCGHQAGDQLLRNIANLLQQNSTNKDVLARVGGDEFCLILVNQDKALVKQNMQKLLDSVSAFRFEWEDRIFHIGASIGIVQMDTQNLNAVDLVKAADSACYMAKNNGRNQYVFHDNSETEIVFRNTELQLLSQVQTALDQDKFELYFQTIKPLDTANNQKIRYEILLRMFDDGGEFISPATFIPIAERHGLMTRIDQWVFNRTLSLLESYPEHVQQLDKCAINLSGASLNSPSSMKSLLNRLKQTSVPFEKLCFEITETAAVTNLVKASHIIAEIRSLGCKFALDDFGAGMSSFTYLKNMQVDYVKIDGSFVKNMCNDACDLATVKAIHDIAKSMNKETIAEFVGDKQTEQLLQSMGVNYAQGFGISTPTSFAVFLSHYDIKARVC